LPFTRVPLTTVSASVSVARVPISVKVPVALSMLYMETLFEPEFVT
jgi:hypothetical protein